MFDEEPTTLVIGVIRQSNVLISIKNNIAILAMTKTGSTAVDAAIAPYCDMVFTGDPRVKHMQLRRFNRFIRPYLSAIGHEQIETACVFREPIAWLFSWYRYRARDNIKGQANSTHGISFNQFVESYLSEEPDAFARVGQQSRFVTDKDGRMGIDHLFRYEEFERFEKFLSHRFAKKLEFPTKNQSQKQDMILSNDLHSQLIKHFETDYEIYESCSRAD